MGDINQLIYGSSIFDGREKRVLEVGSKDYGNTQNYRDLFQSSEYIGVDLESGKNVDLVHDLSKDTGDLQKDSFDLIIICSVLEHCEKPWKLAENLELLLSETGVIFTSHPWVWRYHKYPEDYFRFSPQGVKSLFGSIHFWLPSLYSSYKENEFFCFDQHPDVDNQLAQFDQQGRKYLPYLQTLMLGTRSAGTYQNYLKRWNKTFSAEATSEIVQETL